MSGENTPEDPGATRFDEARPRWRQTTLALFAILFWAACVGALTAFISEREAENQFLRLVVGVPFLMLCVAWCHYDSYERNEDLGRAMGLALVLILIVALPTYLFKTRGLAGFKSIGKVLLFCGGLFAVMFMTAFGAFLLRTALGATPL